jgi:hypothetical protein
MPRYSSVETTGTCPLCAGTVEPPAGEVQFTWGEVPRRYKRGKAVRWLRTKSGAVEHAFAWSLHRGDLRYNAGDPAIQDLLAFEAAENVREHRCPNCGITFETFGVRIKSGVFGEAVFYAQGDCERLFGRQPAALAIVELTAGRPRPRDEWLDPAFVDSSESSDE